MRRSLVSLLVLGVAAGCPAEPSAEDDGAGTGDDTAGDTTAGTMGMVSATGVVDETGAEPALVVARDISIGLVEANQGVAVDIAREGAWLGPAERQAPLIQNRITLVRTFWEIPDDWETREIEAHLVLQFADGTTETKVDRKEVAEESFIGDLDRAFFWGIEAEKMLPGLEFRVELYEVDDARADMPEPDPPPMVPQSGDFELVGVESSFQVMKVVVVPFDYSNGGCNTEADVSEATMQRFQDLLYMQNPIDRLDYEVHSPLTFTGEASNFGELNQILVDLRFDEGALPETYYYGLIDVCMGGLNGAGGQANGIPDDPVNPDNAFQRVSSGLSIDVDFSSETIVHEIGHSQGRRHVTCNGEEGGPNPSYPHDGGVVNEWGFGVVDFALRHPTTHKDYMTYCHPTWVGNWGWNKVYSVIAGLSEWDADFPGNGGVAEDPYSGTILVGTVLPDGRELWSTVPGGIDAARLTPDHSIELTLADGTQASVGARVEPITDGFDGTFQIVAPVPETMATDFAQVVSLNRRSADGADHPIVRTAVREHHRNRIVQR
ncbi:MAG: hypothetical protein AAF721_29235 [Myxococcota bacterium]